MGCLQSGSGQAMGKVRSCMQMGDTGAIQGKALSVRRKRGAQDLPLPRFYIQYPAEDVCAGAPHLLFCPLYITSSQILT